MKLLAGSNDARLAAAGAFALLGRQKYRARLYTDAVDAYRQSLLLRPREPRVLSNLGAACYLAGKPQQGEAYLRRSIRVAPEFLSARSNLLLSLLYSDRRTPAAIAREHRHQGLAWTVASARQPVPKPLGRRRIRIGYVSSDFRCHPVGRFMEPVLVRHDREKFDVVCYHAAALEDETTRRLQSSGVAWTSIARMSDDEAADRIRKDRCDILIDLNGHTNGNRLGVFARRPAAIAATCLGYPGSTGLEAIQYRLTDGVADPPGMTEKLYTEELVRLPGCVLCFRPPVGAPAVRWRRAARSSEFTFGCLNQYQKITDFTVQLWTQILRETPRAKLLLQSLSLNDPRTVESVKLRFERAGIERRRLVLREYSKSYLDVYNTIDLALDPFPFHGATTTCEALWMGTPVISLAGRTFVSRMGTSLLTHAGIDQFIAQSAPEYVRIACQWALDRGRLEELRRGLRSRMKRSRLCDEAGFTAGLEDRLLQLWRE